MEISKIPNRKFQIGDIAYMVMSKDDGGITIDRHEVQTIGWVEKEGTFMEQGEEIKKLIFVPTINTREMLEKIGFEDEIKFCTLEELNVEVHKNLNKKKLW